MKNALHVKELEEFLKKQQLVSTQDLLNFYHQFNPELPISTLRWRIYELKQQGIIYSPMRGEYALKEKKQFHPKRTKRMDEIANLLQEKFPYVKFSIYPTKWVSNLSNHIYQTDNIIVETDIDVLDAAFYFLQENFSNTFLSPDQEMYDYYVSTQEENIIVTRLHFDAPLYKVNDNYYTPKLEKLIVDLLINDPVILPISYSEINTIIMNAIDTYSINFSTLARYAKKKKQSKRLNKLHLIGGTKL
ncbi:hypothetical protein KV134_01980 [Tetragenococcus halophilus]|nr:hypothetical protein KV134_01980 [Tetragenococcus halophilus]